MKGVPRTKGMWCGSGKSGRNARKLFEKRLRRISKRKLEKQPC